jgi:hypothetical protein
MSIKDEINNYLNKKDVDYKKLAEQSYLYDEEECGMIHPTTRASLRFRNNGDVEVFSSGYSGFVASKEGKSANLFGEKINLSADKEVRVNSEPLGFSWNFNIFNPDMTDTKLLVVHDDLLKALDKLLNGGIQVTVTTVPGTGVSQAIGSGSVSGIRPFIKNKKNELINKSAFDMVNDVVGGIF